VLALLTLGEGWHNNHHRFMASARHGFVQPWEIDVTFYAIKRALWDGRPRARPFCD
jgi:stearoyl-CoA desaturase (delta-9 desaturase)